MQIKTSGEMKSDPEFSFSIYGLP